MRSLSWFALVGILFPAIADAAQIRRFFASQNGDFVLVGNTLGNDCNLNPAPVFGDASNGTIGDCGSQVDDSSIDMFWNGDASPPRADVGISASQANSTAQLDVPPGATITYARLYWAAVSPNGSVDTQVSFGLRGQEPSTVTADGSSSIVKAMNLWYQASAEVTTLVQASGAYRVSGVASARVDNRSDNDFYAGWTLIVFYALPSEPYRNLTLFDGADFVQGTTRATVGIAGFQVPNAGFDAKLGVVAYEGDASIDGDQFRFRRGNVGANGFTAGDNLIDKSGGSATDFFDGSRTSLGALRSNAGDRPRLTGDAHSMSGIDIDVVDISGRLQQGDTRATVQATTNGDAFMLGMVVTSISTRAPNFASTFKTVTDLNGGAVMAGDELEYTVTTQNLGNDDAVDVVLYDTLPEQTTFVPGSIVAAQPGEFSNGQVVVRIGTMAQGASATVKFRVTVNAVRGGVIANQARIVARGVLGAPPSAWPSDGNGNAQGAPATTVTLPECNASADCPMERPYCNLFTRVCIDCAQDPSGCSVSADSDSDGLSDADEARIGTDPASADSDGDGLSDSAEVVDLSSPRDSDGDGLIDALDPDDDGDGILTRTELLGGDATMPPDTDGDGVPDYRDLDSDDDGLSDAIEGIDMRRFADDVDGDGVPNYRDTDSDADGRPDAEEGTADQDGDGVPNYLDRDDSADNDADGDGFSNKQETELGTNPLSPDSDGDGIPDRIEIGDPASPTDTDGDGLIDALDPDDDGDGIPTAVERADSATLGNDDVDGDGLPNWLDTDSDGDGRSDTTDGREDTDGDGAPNYLDRDDGLGFALARIFGSGGCVNSALDPCFAGALAVLFLSIWRRSRLRSRSGVSPR